MYTPPQLYIGVNCFTIYDTRLGSSSTSPAISGRVEVLTQPGWMPVCSPNWDSAESRVLCHQFGYIYSSHSKEWITSVATSFYGIVPLYDRCFSIICELITILFLLFWIWVFNFTVPLHILSWAADFLQLHSNCQLFPLYVELMSQL